MLLSCRLAGLSALETYYAGIRVGVQFGPTQLPRLPKTAGAGVEAEVTRAR
jgi:hypothetical protein